MVKINWDEYKEYKVGSHRGDNFATLLDFMKSYYNMLNPTDMFESLSHDDLAKMMLAKRKITDAEDLENYLFQL